MNRRKMMRCLGAAALGSAVTGRSFAEETGVKKVDAHTHFYDPGRKEGVPWPPKGSPLYRKVMPENWRALAEPHGLTHTIAVEASSWLEDNQWLLDLAKRELSIVGVVGNLDVLDEKFSTHLNRFAADRLFRGIRVNQRQFLDHSSKPVFVKSMELLAERGLSLDVNGPQPTLDQAVTLAKKLPDLHIIVDHVGSAGDPKKLTQAWRDGIAAAGECPNLFCKISALVEQTDAADGQAPRDLEYYLPVLEPVWESFGENRLMFASNWPVSDRGAPFATVVDLVDRFFENKSEPVRRKFFRENSKAAYRWIER